MSLLKDWIREACGNPDLADDAILIQKTISGNTRITLIHTGCCQPSAEFSLSPLEISRQLILDNKQQFIHHH